jgi:ribosomal-protein-alanine N-acetyltransferase
MGLGVRAGADLQAARGVAAERDFRAIHLEDTRIAAGGAQSRGDECAGDETEFHQPARIIGGQIDPVEDRGVAFSQVYQARVRRFRLAVVATQLQHDFSMRESEILVKRLDPLAGLFSCHGSPKLSKCGKIKDNRMDKRFAIHPVRQRDLDRILEIEVASFGPDAYDRNLFAEYTRKCGGLFLVAEWGTKVCAYSITALSPSRMGNRAELVSVAVDPAFLGKGAASALMDSTLSRLRRRGIVRLGLMVKVTNQRALGFYEKYGFRKLRRVSRYYEDGADGLCLAKDL